MPDNEYDQLLSVAPSSSYDALLDVAPTSLAAAIGAAADPSESIKQFLALPKDSLRRVALETAAEKIKGFVPTSVKAGAEMASPAVGAVEDIYGTGKKLYNIARGSTVESQFPKQKTFDQFTPQDWTRFGVGTGIDVANAALLHRSLASAGKGHADPQAIAAAQQEAAQAIPSRFGTYDDFLNRAVEQSKKQYRDQTGKEMPPDLLRKERLSADSPQLEELWQASHEGKQSVENKIEELTFGKLDFSKGIGDLGNVGHDQLFEARQAAQDLREIVGLSPIPSPPSAAGILIEHPPDPPTELKEAGESPPVNDAQPGSVLKTIGDGFRNVRDFFTIQPVPKLTREGLDAAAYAHASARNSVVHSVRDLVARVFPTEYKNPELMKQTGDILVKDNILGVYDEAQARLRTADSPQAKKFAADSVKAIEEAHDLDSYNNEVLAVQNNPRLKANIDRWKQWVNPEMDTMYNELKAVDPNTIQEPRGRHFGARINLLPLDQAAKISQFTNQEHAMPELVTANYRNPNVRRDPFARRAKGTGQYSTDPGLILINTLGRRWNEVTKLRFYNDIQAKGAGMILEPGDDPPTGSGFTARLPVKIPETSETGRTRSVEKSLWVKPSIASEVKNVLNTDQAGPNNPIMRFITGIQLLQATDLTAHLKNIHTVVSNSLGASKGWQDAVRRMPFLATADTVGRIAHVTREIAHDTPEIRAEIAEMAKQGLIRPDYPSTGIQKITHGQQAIHAVDTAARVVMNRFYDDLIERGYKPKTSRREFVQQIGEYNRRLIGPTMRFVRDTGMSPFIVAGRTFNRFSRRLLTGYPGFRSESAMQGLAARSYAISGLATATVLPAMINYLTTGRFGGRPSTLIGQIDTGTDNQKGQHRVIDLFQLMGIRRGLRGTGAQAIIEGVREGKSFDKIGGQAREDITTTLSHPWLGPGLAALYSGITGKRLDLRGGANPYIAENVGGGLKQTGENLRVTLKNQNPLLYGLLAPLIGETEDTYTQGIMRGFLKTPLSTLGYQEKTGSDPVAQTYSLLDRFMDQSSDPKVLSQAVRRVREHFESDYSHLNRALVAANKEQATKAILDLISKKGKSGNDIMKYYGQYPTRAFSGSKKLEVAFVASLSPEEREIYRQAVRRRLDVSHAFYSLLKEKGAE